MGVDKDLPPRLAASEVAHAHDPGDPRRSTTQPSFTARCASVETPRGLRGQLDEGGSRAPSGVPTQPLHTTPDDHPADEVPVSSRSVLPASPLRHAHRMDGDWIDAQLMPALAGVAERDWTVESLRAFVSDLSQMISAAVQSGELSREGAGLARERVGTAMSTVPGVTTETAVADIHDLTATTTSERRDE